MKLAFGIVSTLFLLTTITGGSAAGLPGKYQVASRNADGSSYEGTAEIFATSENTCRIRWETGSTTS